MVLRPRRAGGGKGDQGAGAIGAGKPLEHQGVGAGVLEYRIDWGPGYRVYFGRAGEVLVILLTGGTKKRQQRDIDAAHALWVDYKKRRPRPK